MGNILLELLGGGGKVSIIRQGTHQCLAKKWGLMSVQQGEGERLTLSQSMSTNIMVTVQLSPASIGGGTNSFCQGGDVCKLECEIEIFPALQQVNFNR